MSCTVLDGQAACCRLAGRGRVAAEDPALVRRQAQFQARAAQIRQRLYRFALRNLGNAHDAEDITQEALTRAWIHFDTFDPQRSFEAWVFRIATNLIIDHNRRRKRRQEISLDTSAACMEENEGVCGQEPSRTISDPQDGLMAKESRTELLSTMCTLSPMHQATLLLLAQEHSYEQIARTLDCPLGTVRSRVHRARVLLRRNLITRTSHESPDAWQTTR